MASLHLGPDYSLGLASLLLRRVLATHGDPVSHSGSCPLLCRRYSWSRPSLLTVAVRVAWASGLKTAGVLGAENGPCLAVRASTLAASPPAVPPWLSRQSLFLSCRQRDRFREFVAACASATSSVCGWVGGCCFIFFDARSSLSNRCQTSALKTCT